MSGDFARDPSWYFEDDRRSAAVDALRHYCKRYTGSWFDRLADYCSPNAITARDILAVSTLNVDVPAGSTIWLLEVGADQVTALLERIPPHQAIWDLDADLSDEGPAWELWDLLKKNKWPNDGGGTKMGTTKISKLLAAKRPNLIPIEDRYIRKGLFGGVEPKDYWKPWRRLHTTIEGERLRSLADDVRNEAEIEPSLPILRVIDIVIWSWERK